MADARANSELPRMYFDQLASSLPPDALPPDLDLSETLCNEEELGRLKQTLLKYT